MGGVLSLGNGDLGGELIGCEALGGRGSFSTSGISASWFDCLDGSLGGVGAAFGCNAPSPAIARIKFAVLMRFSSEEFPSNTLNSRLVRVTNLASSALLLPLLLTLLLPLLLPLELVLGAR